MSFEIDYFYATNMVSVKRHRPNDSSPSIHPLFSLYIVLFTALARTHFYRRPTIVPPKLFLYFLSIIIFYYSKKRIFRQRRKIHCPRIF